MVLFYGYSCNNEHSFFFFSLLLLFTRGVVEVVGEERGVVINVFCLSIKEILSHFLLYILSEVIYFFLYFYTSLILKRVTI